jgi:hypothetical protein
MTLHQELEGAVDKCDYLELVWAGPKIDPKFKQEWLEALRSGKYKQTSGALARFRKYQTVPPKSVGFCCLGVACDISGYTWDISKGEETCYDTFTPDALAPSRISAGETIAFPFFPDEFDRERPPLGYILSGLNDTGCTFEEIADWIETNL